MAYDNPEELLDLLHYAEQKNDSEVVIKLRAEIKEVLGYDPETELEQRRRNIRS